MRRPDRDTRPVLNMAVQAMANDEGYGLVEAQRRCSTSLV